MWPPIRLTVVDEFIYRRSLLVPSVSCFNHREKQEDGEYFMLLFCRRLKLPFSCLTLKNKSNCEHYTVRLRGDECVGGEEGATAVFPLRVLSCVRSRRGGNPPPPTRSCSHRAANEDQCRVVSVCLLFMFTTRMLLELIRDKLRSVEVLMWRSWAVVPPPAGVEWYCMLPVEVSEMFHHICLGKGCCVDVALHQWLLLLLLLTWSWTASSC